MAQLTPIQLLLPAQIDALRLREGAAASDWVGSVVTFGLVSGVAGVCAIIAYPLTGALSDRTHSRWGRRRPWIAGGAVLFALALVLLGAQEQMLGIVIGWSLALIGFCVVTAAITATISDSVPVRQRGVISAWISAPQAIGIILGLVLVSTVFTGTFSGYVAVAVLLLLLVAPFVLVERDAVGPRPVARGLLASLWISPRAHPDFAWTLTGRILVNLGNALGTSLLFYFLLYGLGTADAEGALILLTLVYMLFVVLASLLGGRLSDRTGLRRPFVLVAAVVQAAAALLLAFAPVFSVALIAAGLLGLGYGVFLSVDQALATQVLPDPADRGKDLGIMNIAAAFPQAMGPLLGAGVVAASGGFAALFVTSAVCGLAGAFAVWRVRSVR
ncbi:MFS transporter [Microbacteriaceae bacterium VKM Ac-2855]|nr:MFS transporter [Microbacteriaceae bacterium VKM Ac-2855]